MFYVKKIFNILINIQLPSERKKRGKCKEPTRSLSHKSERSIIGQTGCNQGELSFTAKHKPENTDIEVSELHEIDNNCSDCCQINPCGCYRARHTESEGTQSNIETNKVQWELRAFTTNVIIASTTVLLTCPIIASFWYDLFSGSVLIQKIRFIFAVLYLINSVINPFIYAWRLPEIRQEFRRLFRLN